MPTHATVQAKGDSDLKADDDDEDDDDANAAAADASASAAGGGGGALADRKIPPIVSHWNLAEYLPASVRQVFLILVSTFLLKPHEKARQLRLDHERYGDGDDDDNDDAWTCGVCCDVTGVGKTCCVFLSFTEGVLIFVGVIHAWRLWKLSSSG